MIAEIIFSTVLAGSPTFTQDVKPIIEQRCTPCHTGQIRTLPNFLKYDIAFKKRFIIESRVVYRRDMPPGNSTAMTKKERQIIKGWIEGGAKK